MPPDVVSVKGKDTLVPGAAVPDPSAICTVCATEIALHATNMARSELEIDPSASKLSLKSNHSLSYLQLSWRSLRRGE